MNVFEVYVEKKPEFSGLEKTRVFSRYFIQGISQAEFEAAKLSVFSDPAVDFVYDKLPALDGARVLALELLPGQFDQRADSVAQCIFLLTGKEKPIVQTATIYAYYGNISEQEWKRIKSELINPVECREADLEKPKTLYQEYPKPDDVAVLDGFTGFSHNELIELLKKLNITMDLSDLIFCQNYFRDEEKRDPTITEIRLLDTYWSDHCRHTTFLTELDAQIEDEPLRESFDNYLEIKKTLDRDNHPVTLMDIATIGARALKAQGMLSDLDESDEINACSVKIKVDVDGVLQDWLLMFKNETHNHPTEIEPFGGASTCLGGAIRDPLSGRAYVYQAMRITGAADPLRSDTLPGKLPQRLICQKAAEGYSSYGNQIGVATGHVAEVYHDGYAAKRMELGAVIGAVPAENVVRELPTPGDVVILVGGRTGRDGIGGATGSSKTQGPTAMETFAAEVQKGNAPEERKIQRLFRNSKVSRLIKKCNDFGAGGVSVSVGELADGILINLDKVPVKYEGLDGTELAISESQERMSIVVSKENASLFIELANEENLEAVIIAEVTQEKRMVMNWRGKTIVNLSRDFLNSNGASKQAKAQITEPVFPQIKNKIADAASLEKLMGSLSYCSQKGLVQMFDSSAGRVTVLAPLGGKYQLTPAQTMAAKLPLLNGITKTSSLMSWGFDPVISTISPYHGAIFAVVISAAKIIAAGGSRKRLWLSFQEYFEKLRDEPSRWGKPLAALLGALDAQLGLKIAAIGGKDSMSGSFTTADGKNIDVPPTLVSFAVSTANIDNLISPEFKRCGSYVYHFKSPFTVFEKPNFNKLNDYFDVIEKLITDGKILSAWAVGSGGTAEAIVKMCVGNRFGFDSEQELTAGNGFGGFILEAESQIDENRSELLGRTT
ncbi:MAG: phosphoribosylformylglycinamidine synthase, partial [Treponema sp.]|nr:phosphoribosylformylglycinamidine synthase [Treponema sp.]